MVFEHARSNNVHAGGKLLHAGRKSFCGRDLELPRKCRRTSCSANRTPSSRWQAVSTEGAKQCSALPQTWMLSSAWVAPCRWPPLLLDFLQLQIHLEFPERSAFVSSLISMTWLDTIIKVHGKACDTWSVKDATTKLHDGLRWPKALVVLSVSGASGQSLLLPGLPQMQASSTKWLTLVWQCKEWRLSYKNFLGYGSKLVAVKRTNKRQAWFSPSAWKIPGGAKAWNVQEVFRMFCSAMFKCYTAVGDKVFNLSWTSHWWLSQ